MPEKYSVVRYLIYLAFHALKKGAPIPPDAFEALRGEGICACAVEELFDEGLCIEEAYRTILASHFGIPMDEEEEEETCPNPCEIAELLGCSNCQERTSTDCITCPNNI